jgi:hydroxymethylbilane synthase
VGALSVRIGARSSRLSQAQTATVSDLIRNRFGERLALELISVKTRGDRLPPEARRIRGEAGAKGAFTGDIEALLLKGEIDVAVHSMKDLTSVLTKGLAIGATPPRSDPRDALIATHNRTIETLPKGAKIGTSSLRRKAQLLGMRQDLEVVELHGNVDTRLRAVVGSETREAATRGLDAIVLAVAGLERLGERARISQTFSIGEMVPAVGQGIIAVQMRRDDRDMARVLSQIDDEATALEASCERAFAQRLGADCYVPVGGCARASGAKVRIVGMMANEDGTGLRRKAIGGDSSDAVSLGTRLAEELLERGAAS